MKDRQMVIFLMILSTVCVLFLASAEYAYKQASHIFNVRLYRVINNMFEIKASDEDTEKVFLEHFEIKEVGRENYYISKGKVGIPKGTILFKEKGPGLWSEIDLLIAVNPDRETLYGIRVISQAETPGLGARITEKEFLVNFKDAIIRPDLKVVKFASAPNEVDAVTGATATSDGVEDIINKGIKRLDQAFSTQKTEETDNKTETEENAEKKE